MNISKKQYFKRINIYGWLTCAVMCLSMSFRLGEGNNIWVDRMSYFLIGSLLILTFQRAISIHGSFKKVLKKKLFILNNNFNHWFDYSMDY